MEYKEIMKEWAKRRRQIVRRFESGESKSNIAKRFGITRERVRQIIEKESNA